MREFKDTRIEFSGEGDVELLDYALSNMAFGKVERNRRLLNVERWEHIQLSVTRKGKRRIWQPFRAEYKRTAAGTHVVTTSYNAFFAQEFIKKAGFTIVKVEPGNWPDNGSASGMKINYSCTLNGRRFAISIETK